METGAGRIYGRGISEDIVISAAEQVFLISRLGNMVFANAGAPEERLLELAQSFSLEPFFYFLFRDRLPKRFRFFGRCYHQRSALALRQQYALEQLYRKLEEEKIRFVPIKGADLAYRIYPQPALRSFGDWDILIAPKQLQRFCELLKRENWECPVDSRSDHHMGMRCKAEFRLEPHFTLPNFGNVPPETIWRYCIPAAEGSSRHVLLPELNLIMLFQHNSICQYQSVNLVKLLLDVGFLLKRLPVSWSLVTSLCVEMKVPHPGLLLSAFPEFFPEELRPELPIPGEVVELLRALLLVPRFFLDRQREIEMRIGTPFQGAWWRARLSRLSAENLRWKYHLPNDYGAVIHLYRMWDIMRKSFFLLRHFGSDIPEELRNHLNAVSRVDGSWKLLLPFNCEKCDGHTCSGSMLYCTRKHE